MPVDPIEFPPEPVNKKDPHPIEVTGFGWGESSPVEASDQAEAEEPVSPPAKK